MLRMLSALGLLVFIQAAVAAAPNDEETPPAATIRPAELPAHKVSKEKTPYAVTIGPFEMSAHSLQVKADAAEQQSGRVPLLSGALSGEAVLKIGDLVARADKITIAMDKERNLELHLAGHGRITYHDEEEWEATGDQIAVSRTQLSILSGAPGDGRLRFGRGDKASEIIAASIRFDLSQRRVQADGGTSVRLGK